MDRADLARPSDLESPPEKVASAWRSSGSATGDQTCSAGCSSYRGRRRRATSAIVDPERLERFGRRYPAASGDGRLRAAARRPRAWTRSSSRRPSSPITSSPRASLDAGKHTFVEKPLAPSSRRGRRADRASPPSAAFALMCGHTFLYSPPVARSRSCSTTDELGDLYFISSSRVNLGLHQRDVSVIWDLGPHDFSILLYWLDECPTRSRRRAATRSFRASRRRLHRRWASRSG